jgi:hypothetical protein
MSGPKRPMRRYVPPVLVCARCRMRIHGETRMVAGELYHPECAPRTVPA